MTYASFTPIQTLTLGITKSLGPTDTNTLITQAITTSDHRVEHYLTDHNLTPPDSDDLLTEASNLFSAAMVLDVYYANKDNRSPSAVLFEKQAQELLDEYVSIAEEIADVIPAPTASTYEYDKDYD